MSKSFKLIGLAVASAFALTACGGGDDVAEVETNTPAGAPSELPPADGTDDDHDAATAMEPGEYELQGSEGGHMVFDLPTDPSDEAVADVAQYFDDLGVGPVTFIVVDVDNRDGEQLIKIPELAVFDPEGNEYEFENLGWSMTEWQAERSWETEDEEFWLPDGTPIDVDTYADLYDQYEDLEESLTSSVSPSGRDDLVLAYVGDDFPDEFTRVTLLPYGAGYEEDALPTES